MEYKKDIFPIEEIIKAEPNIQGPLMRFANNDTLNYEHSIRVAKTLGQIFGNVGFYFGILHDLGKIDFNSSDFTNPEIHTIDFVSFNNVHHVPKIITFLNDIDWGYLLNKNEKGMVISAVSKHHNDIKPSFSRFDTAAQIADKADRARWGVNGRKDTGNNRESVISSLQDVIMGTPAYKNAAAKSRVDLIIDSITSTMFN